MSSTSHITPVATVRVPYWVFGLHVKEKCSEAYCSITGLPKLFDNYVKNSRITYGPALVLLFTTATAAGRTECIRELLDVKSPSIGWPDSSGRPGPLLEFGEPVMPHYTLKLGKTVFVGCKQDRKLFLNAFIPRKDGK